MFLYTLSCLRPKFITPDLEVADISRIDPDFLDSQNIRALVFDVDNTLTVWNGVNIHSSIETHFTRLIQRFDACIVSNTTPKRREQLENYFGLHAVQTDVRKPLPAPFLEALSYLGTKPCETAMIGDRLITDIAGAKKVGFYTIKVNPLQRSSEPFHHTIARELEWFIYRAYCE